MSNGQIEALRRRVAADPENEAMRKRGYQPLFSASSRARIAVIGQAPGLKAQEAGVPWADRSGDRLRDWLGVSEGDFYDAQKLALVPMDFYFPGRGRSGDLPPRRGFAEKWHKELFELLPRIRLRLLIGQYAQAFYLGRDDLSVTARIRAFESYLPEGLFPLPHPSPRNNIWLKRNPWFGETVLPILRRTVADALRKGDRSP